MAISIKIWYEPSNEDIMQIQKFKEIKNNNYFCRIQLDLDLPLMYNI